METTAQIHQTMAESNDNLVALRDHIEKIIDLRDREIAAQRLQEENKGKPCQKIGNESDDVAEIMGRGL